MTKLLFTPAQTLVVVERKGDWAAALRLTLSESPTTRRSVGSGRTLLDAIRLIELRSLDELWPVVQEHPAAAVALEVTYDHIEQFVAALMRLDREFPAVAAFAVADRGHAAYSGVIREAGALCVIDSPRQLPSVCVLIKRHGSNDRTTKARRHEDGKEWTGLT